MKIKRFTAASIRQALDQVREEQGPDAVILSSKQIEQGVEVVAATDYDEALLHQMHGKPSPPKQSLPLETADTQEHSTQSPALPQRDSGNVEAEYNSLRKEFGSLRSLVQSQLSQLSWSSLSSDRPEHAALVRSLTGIGLAGDIVANIAKELDAINDPANAWREAVALFAKQIPLTQEDSVIRGGRYALVGATGVGKTTTIAKLATRHVLEQGNGDIGLVSYETQAMAAPDQLVRAGKILGLPVQHAHNPTDLRDTLSQLDSKKLVLIDTPGRSPGDSGANSTLAGLVDPSNKVKTLLALSGNTQEGFQKETVRQYRHLELEGVAITKLDETTNLGALLSILIRERLKIAYVTEGQELNSGLRSAHAYRAGIASRAVSLAKRFRDPTPLQGPAKNSSTNLLMARA